MSCSTPKLCYYCKCNAQNCVLYVWSVYTQHTAAHYLLCWMVQVEEGVLCLKCTCLSVLRRYWTLLHKLYIIHFAPGVQCQCSHSPIYHCMLYVCRTEEYVNTDRIISPQLQAACCTDYSPDTILLQGNQTDQLDLVHICCYVLILYYLCVYKYIYTPFRVTTTCLCVQLPSWQSKLGQLLSYIVAILHILNLTTTVYICVMPVSLAPSEMNNQSSNVQCPYRHCQASSFQNTYVQGRIIVDQWISGKMPGLALM